MSIIGSLLGLVQDVILNMQNDAMYCFLRNEIHLVRYSNPLGGG